MLILKECNIMRECNYIKKIMCFPKLKRVWSSKCTGNNNYVIKCVERHIFPKLRHSKSKATTWSKNGKMSYVK